VWTSTLICPTLHHLCYHGFLGQDVLWVLSHHRTAVFRCKLWWKRLSGATTQNPNNPFHFDTVRLNLLGDTSYNPTLPFVSKVVTSTGRIAGDLGTYVDDLRPIGSTKHHCQAVAHRISTILCYLGLQDALCKRTAPSLRAGACGTLVHSNRDAVSVTQEKWEHARGYLYQMQETLDKDNLFDFKMLEKQRGFLVYLACTYPALTPFLKGIRLMVDSWQSNRDSDGWKLSGELAARTENEIPQTYDMHPDKVQGVPQLQSDHCYHSSLPHDPRVESFGLCTSLLFNTVAGMLLEVGLAALSPDPTFENYLILLSH
jgi:hypothetical protein